MNYAKNCAKNYAEKWLEATQQGLKQRYYGNKGNCAFCICCNKYCYLCIISVLKYPGESNFLPCSDWDTDDFCTPRKVRRFLLELQYALKDYIRRNK